MSHIFGYHAADHHVDDVIVDDDDDDDADYDITVTVLVCRKFAVYIVEAHTEFTLIPLRFQPPRADRGYLFSMVSRFDMCAKQFFRLRFRRYHRGLPLDLCGLKVPFV